MGRWSTGIDTNTSCKRIELSFMLKSGYIQKGKIIKGSMCWTRRGEPNGSVSFVSSYTKAEKYLRLIYTSIDSRTGENINFDYMIDLVTVPSNLGKGEVLYMMCPSNNDIRCRKLYLAYRSHKWYSRQYYIDKGLRIYYPSQAYSKKDLAYNQRLKYEKILDDFYSKKNFHSHHKGNETKSYKIFKEARRKSEYWENQVCANLTAFINKYS